MRKLKAGVIAGLIFGVLDVLLMIPIPMEGKIIAMEASFIGRFAIGFLVINTNLPIRSWLKGLIIGLMLSLPDAIITNTYLPIVGIGMVGGLIIGIIDKK